MTQEMPDFDTLLTLAQTNPDKLEKLRKELTNQLISTAPQPRHHRLRGLQFQIDVTRQLAKTPLAACIRISNMMQQSFAELAEALNRPVEDTDYVTTTQDRFNTAYAGTNVLYFPCKS